MKTIDEAKKAKIELERKISDLLNQYSKEYNCHIDSVDITILAIGIEPELMYKTTLDVKL